MAFVQDWSQAGTVSGGTSVTIAITGVSAGSTLVCWVSKENGAQAAASDPSNGAWTHVRTVANGTTWSLSALIFHNAAPGDYTITATWTGSAGFRGVYVQEYSGRSGLDNSAGQRQTTGTSRTSGDFTVAAGADIAACCQDYNQLAQPTATTGTGQDVFWGYGSTNTGRGSSEDNVGGGTDSAVFGTNTGADSFIIAMSLAAAGGAATVYDRTVFDSSIFSSRVIRR